jgi:hypothetical protein
MVSDEVELTDEDIIVIVDESEERRPMPTRYQPDPDYGSDPQWRSPEAYEVGWDDGEITEPLKEVR